MRGVGQLATRSLTSRVRSPGATYRYSAPMATSVIPKNTSARRLRSEMRIAGPQLEGSVSRKR